MVVDIDGVAIRDVTHALRKVFTRERSRTRDLLDEATYTVGATLTAGRAASSMDQDLPLHPETIALAKSWKRMAIK